MALCGKCKKSGPDHNPCAAGREIQYPTMVNEHDCPDYEYDPSGEVVEKTAFNIPEHDYCIECAHHFNGVCDGKGWVPYKTVPRCEFFRDASMICSHAEPYIQYGNGIRNNKCIKFNRSCPWAHSSSHLACYEPVNKAYADMTPTPTQEGV